MTTNLFEKWMHSLNDKMKEDQCTIALIMGNCLSHADLSNLSNVHTIFLLPNTTQPLDAGIIKAMKHESLKRLIALENNAPFCYIAFVFFNAHGSKESTSTKVNCFNKVGLHVLQVALQ